MEFHLSVTRIVALQCKHMHILREKYVRIGAARLLLSSAWQQLSRTFPISFHLRTFPTIDVRDRELRLVHQMTVESFMSIKRSLHFHRDKRVVGPSVFLFCFFKCVLQFLLFRLILKLAFRSSVGDHSKLRPICLRVRKVSRMGVLMNAMFSGAPPYLPPHVHGPKTKVELRFANARVSSKRSALTPHWLLLLPITQLRTFAPPRSKSGNKLASALLANQAKLLL